MVWYKMSETNEQVPVDQFVKVIDYTNVYKTKKWWCAVVLADMAGHTKLMVYLWQWTAKKKNVGGKWVESGEYHWKRKQKFGINSAKNWETIKKIIEEKYINKLPEGF